MSPTMNMNSSLCAALLNWLTDYESLQEIRDKWSEGTFCENGNKDICVTKAFGLCLDALLSEESALTLESSSGIDKIWATPLTEHIKMNNDYYSFCASRSVPLINPIFMNLGKALSASGNESFDVERLAPTSQWLLPESSAQFYRQGKDACTKFRAILPILLYRALWAMAPSELYSFVQLIYSTAGTTTQSHLDQSNDEYLKDTITKSLEIFMMIVEPLRKVLDLSDVEMGYTVDSSVVQSDEGESIPYWVDTSLDWKPNFMLSLHQRARPWAKAMLMLGTAPTNSGITAGCLDHQLSELPSDMHNILKSSDAQSKKIASINAMGYFHQSVHYCLQSECTYFLHYDGTAMITTRLCKRNEFKEQFSHQKQNDELRFYDGIKGDERDRDDSVEETIYNMREKFPSLHLDIRKIVMNGSDAVLGRLMETYFSCFSKDSMFQEAFKAWALDTVPDFLDKYDQIEDKLDVDRFRPVSIQQVPNPEMDIQEVPNPEVQDNSKSIRQRRRMSVPIPESELLPNLATPVITSIIKTEPVLVPAIPQ